MGLGPPDALARLTDAVPNPVGMCPASAEAALQLRLVRALFTETWPGEIDLSPKLGPLDALMASGACRHVFAGPLWRDRTRDLDVFENADISGFTGDRSVDRLMQFQLLTRAPWLRQGVGGVLLAIASPDLNRYDE